METSTQQKLVDYLLPIWGINKEDVEKVELLQAKINNNEVKL